MSRRESWKGMIPESRSAARQYLLEAAGKCIARHGFSKVTLSDVAEEAGVTRPTVYRYFQTAEELLNAAAVVASGGFLERMRSRTQRFDDPVARVVENMVISILEIPEDPNLSELFRIGDAVSVHSEYQNAYVARELRSYFDDGWPLDDRDLHEIAEILLRLLKSFLDDPGPNRDADELRRYFSRWLEPMLRQRLVA